MKWASAFSDTDDYEESISNCIVQIERQGCSEPQIMFVYFRPSFFGVSLQIANIVERAFPSAHVVCCGSAAMMSGLEELSEGSCITLMAGELPNVEVDVAHIDPAKEPGADASPNRWYDFTQIPKKYNQNFIVLADPYSLHLENVLKGMDYAYEATLVGGFASGMQFKGETVLIVNGVVYNYGAILVSLSGAIDLVPLVAQGCRGIGEDLEVTECNEVVLEKVNGRSPMLCLKEVAEGLTESDKTLLHQSLFIGVEMDSLSMETKNSEYLIRNIRGINPESGALVVGDHIQEGQTVRFHIRDPQSSQGELMSMVDQYKIKMSTRECRGMMVFSCLGRLADFYGEESVDASIASTVNEEAPLSGLFCSGEIGPIYGSSYIHGYTAVVAFFYETVK
ncbi:MAG: FIST C-terminal domain-containing protein [Lentisphaerales bacterium]|nr:FIST C-terminal domain-containing protein [Lentisphaerales bacterium]